MLNAPSANHVADSKTWNPGSRMDIHTIEAVLGTLTLTLMGADRMAIDVSEVNVIDTSGVQLLLTLARSLKEQGIPLHCIGRSAAIDQAFHTLGLSAFDTIGGRQ